MIRNSDSENRGALLAYVADRFAREDENRREELARLVRCKVCGELMTDDAHERTPGVCGPECRRRAERGGSHARPAQP